MLLKHLKKCSIAVGVVCLFAASTGMARPHFLPPIARGMLRAGAGAFMHPNRTFARVDAAGAVVDGGLFAIMRAHRKARLEKRHCYKQNNRWYCPNSRYTKHTNKTAA